MILRFLLLSAFFCLPASAVAAAPETPEIDTDIISAELYKIEAYVEDKRFLLQHLDDYLEQLPAYVTWAKKCISDSSTHLTDTEERLNKLGESVVGEPTDVSFTRQNLKTKKSDLDSTLASCKAILVRSEAAIKEISIFRKENLEKQSLDRGRHIITVINEAVTESHQWVNTLGSMLVSAEGIHALTISELLMLASIFAIAFSIGVLIRYALHRWDSEALSRWQRTTLEETDTGTRVLAALAMTIRRYIVPLLVSTSIGVFLYVETHHMVPTPLITIIMETLPLLILTFAVTYLVFKALPGMGLREDIDPAVANSLRRSFNTLALVWLIGYMLFQTILAHSLSEAAFFLARAILGVILVLNVIWIIWLTREFKTHGFNRSVRIIVSLILFGTLIAELTGYRNLSGYVLRGVVGTLIMYGLLQIFVHLIKSLLDEINSGKSSWQQKIRKSVGIEYDKSIPGFFWVRAIAYTSLWILFLAGLVYVWNIPETELKLFGSYVTQGFTVGTIEIVPIRIFEAIIAMILLLAINGWFQSRFNKKWLTLTSMERGARESVATVANYIGITVSVIIALAIAGMDFSKLAIIAGALSVGIGFGLKNIAENFISGLILLFERPIKTGDWVVAGTVEGTVKKISIRSTQIETFNHADVIVPNAELISNNLTNWVHKNKNARIIIPVSVAYGSDIGKVREILLSLAHAHPDAIIGSSTMHDPKVLFLSFGESSLDFELRFFVRDITKRLDILSDMYFSIDKAFREHGIEIPFPQRDIHIHKSDSKTTNSSEDDSIQ